MSTGRGDAYRCGLGGAESENVPAGASQKQNQDGPEYANRACDRASRSDFSVSLAALCTVWEHLGITWGLLCVHEGYFGKVLVCFRKILIFQIDFNDFMQVWGELVATLLALGGHFGVT